MVFGSARRVRRYLGAAIVGGCVACSTTALSTNSSDRTAPAAPVTVTTTSSLRTSDGAAGDNFGGALWYDTFSTPIRPVYVATPQEAAMSSDGTVVAVGSPGSAAVGGTGAGAVYVFRRGETGWTQVAKLVALDGAAYDGLGWSVAMSGDGKTIVAGAPYTDHDGGIDVGTAYVFSYVGGAWVQSGELRGSDSAGYDNFGWSVGLARDGATTIVGATSHAVGAVRGAGAAYVFRRGGDGTGWAQRTVLRANHPASGASFGWASTLSGDGTTAAVTAATHMDGQHVLHQGFVEVVASSDGWATSTRKAHIVDPNHNENGDTDAYGVAVVLSDDGRTMALAVPDVNIGSAIGAGAVHLLVAPQDWSVRSGIGRVTSTMIKPRVAAPYLYYGSAVALAADGSRLFIGNDGAGSDDQGSGEAVVFDRSDPNRVRVASRTAIVAPNTTKGRFGTAVAGSSDLRSVVATAPWLTVDGRVEQGAAFVLALRYG